MKHTVIPRHADDLGRLPVPIDFRKTLEISTDQDTEVYLSDPSDDGTITLSLKPSGAKAVIQAKLGFLVLPQTYRFQYGFVGCTVDFWIEGEKLKFKKTVPQCVISGNTEDLVRYKDTDTYISKQVVLELYQSLC